MKKGDRLCKRIFWAFLAVLWLTAAAFGQSQQDTSQSSQQPSSQTQSQTELKKSEAGGDATKKSEKEKAKPKKVYTEDDLSGMRGNGVSIVGDEKPAGGGAAGAKKATGKPGVVPMSGRDEAYWRGTARVLLDQIAATEQQIAKLKDDMKKYGTGGFDVTTGMKNNVAYIEDWNGQVKDLERKKRTSREKWTSCRKKGGKREPSRRGSAEGARSTNQSGETQRGATRREETREGIWPSKLLCRKKDRDQN